VHGSSTSLILDVSIDLEVFVSVEPLTSAEEPRPLKPALVDTDSDTSLPEVTVIPIAASCMRCNSEKWVWSFRMRTRK
jgi:hypothetical protein